MRSAGPLAAENESWPISGADFTGRARRWVSRAGLQSGLVPHRPGHNSGPRPIALTEEHMLAQVNQESVLKDEVTCANGMPSFLARPAGPGPHPVMVVLHERYGLQDH